jgi:hypothetical protein
VSLQLSKLIQKVRPERERKKRGREREKTIKRERENVAEKEEREPLIGKEKGIEKVE